MQDRASLPRASRLARRADFSEVIKFGSRFRDEYFSIHAQPDVLPQAQLGVTVSRRVSRRSVTRNRVKRQIRESFRHHQHLLCGVRIVVMAQPPAGINDNQRLRESLDKHWGKVSQVCSKSQPRS